MPHAAVLTRPQLDPDRLPSCLESSGFSARAIWSDALPDEKPSIRRIGLVGTLML